MAGVSEREVDTWLPAPTPATAPFFDGAREGKLRLQCCAACDTWAYPLRERCQSCGATEMTWRDASGAGTLYSFGLLRRVYHPRHEGRLPLILAEVNIAEGIRLSTNLVEIEPADIRIGMMLMVDFETLPDGGVIPVFKPA